MAGKNVYQAFTLMLIIEKCLSHQTPLVLSFIDYKPSFDSLSEGSLCFRLAKVLSFHCVPDKYIKVISLKCKNNTAAVKVGNEFSCWFLIKSRVKQGYILSPFIWIILIDLVLRSIVKAMGEHGIKLGGKLPWI